MTTQDNEVVLARLYADCRNVPWAVEHGERGTQ